MDYSRLARELSETIHVISKIMHPKKLSDLFMGESFILHYLGFNGGTVLPNEISSAMSISTARVAAVLNKLEGKGLIIREIDKSDRRKILVTLTDEGRAVSEEKKKKVLSETERLLRLLGDKDATELVRISEKLKQLAINEEQEPLNQ